MELNNLETPFTVHLSGNFGFNEDGSRASQFKWAVLDKPMVVKNDEQSTIILHNKEDQKNSNLRLQMMRLFACNIVRDLLTNSGTVDQNTLQDTVKFDLPKEIKDYTAKVVNALGSEIINEIIYEIDPIKPTKSKLDSLSLIPKQEQTIQNIENGQERTQTDEQ